MLDPGQMASEVQGMRKPRLAIVSTFDELCGIAGYTRHLVKQIAADFDIEVFDLDQFMMRSTNRRVRKVADQMIRDICHRLTGFDFVNVQLEYGILGRKRDDIIRRFGMIAASAPSLSVTFHTILPQEPFPWAELDARRRGSGLGAALKVISRHRNDKVLTSRVYGLLRKLQLQKLVNVIVHTRRDARVMKYVNGLDNIFDHPLAFLSRGEVKSLREGTTRSDFPALADLSADTKLIGVFGFISEYKGFDTAIRALYSLPDNYHIALFGGIHPNEIKPANYLNESSVNPYLRKLLDQTSLDLSVMDSLQDRKMSVSLALDQVDRLFNHPKKIGSRLHFIGVQSDDKFAGAMGICDFVVLPYEETNQSSSGPISIALEMGARVLATRNHAFMQFARYHPDSVEFFDIGNHLELAERIRAAREWSPPELQYDAATNAAMYVAANTARGPKRLTPSPEATAPLVARKASVSEPLK